MSQLFTGIQTLARALDYHLERHNVIASNIANVDTPGFAPFDVVRDDADPTRSASLLATNERHFRTVGAGPEALAVQTVEDRTVRPGADGNSVSLERETAKLAANDIRYESAVKIISSRFAILRYVANDGVGQ